MIYVYKILYSSKNINKYELYKTEKMRDGT